MHAHLMRAVRFHGVRDLCAALCGAPKRKGRLPAVAVWVLGLLLSHAAMGNCTWSPVHGAAFVDHRVQFTDLGRWLRKTLWVDEARYGAGTLMALSTVSLRPAGCLGLFDLRGRPVDFVYVPPIEAVWLDNGYVIPAQAPGASLKLEFPGALGKHPDGVLISTNAQVSSGGGLSASAMPALNIRVALVKTDAFAQAGARTLLTWPSGLGYIRYYDAQEPDVYSAHQIALVMGPIAVDTTGIAGSAVSTACTIGRRFRGRSHRDGGALAEGSVVSLAAVSSSDFSGLGPLDKGAANATFAFHCTARANTEVRVSFDATFPFDNGLSGVGMPQAQGDIGVQILLDGVPVQLGVGSQALRWEFTRSSGYPLELPDRSMQGRYCVADCGDNTSLTNPNWVEGDGGTGDNEAIQSAITFKYFQTTQQRPEPRSFSVPFTVTVEWN